MKPKTKKILKYMVAPQLLPRMRTLFYSGFSYIAFFMAQIYRSVRLLPAGHPYLVPDNMGKFGIRHVIVEAGNNLEIKRENIDQIAIFAMMVIGILLLGAQIFMLFLSGFVEVANAQLLYGSSNPWDFFSYFSTPTATHDLAFVLLDRVFGIPGTTSPVNTSFFADVNGNYSCVVTGQACFFNLPQSSSSRVLTPDNVIYQGANIVNGTLVPANPFLLTFPWPFHEALRGMLQFYSVGLLVIGVCIFIYFIFAIAAETTQTGTAYGQRFNHLWAPIRIVVAMGLLIPISYGLNPAQWILMYAAKWGSGFATNGWIIYNNAITSEQTPLGDNVTLVATPQSPPLNTLLEFGAVLATCKLAYEEVMHQRTNRPAVNINAWLINPSDLSLQPRLLSGTSFDEAVEYFNGGSIHVRFGELRNVDDASQTWDGRVVPWCGELSLDLTYTPPIAGGTMTEPGSYFALGAHYELMQILWQDASGGGNIGSVFTPAPLITFAQIGRRLVDRHIWNNPNPNAPVPQDFELASLRLGYEGYIRQQINQAVALQAGSPEWQEKLLELGWGGAAIWYNKVAQLNGGLVSAVYSLPTIRKYPFVLEENQKRRAGSDDAVSGQAKHTLYRSTDAQTSVEDKNNIDLINVMNQARTLWNDSYSDRSVSAGAFIDAINTIFGTKGLFDITSNEAQNIHPLAQLAAIGRSIVDSAIHNLGYSVAAGLGGGLANMMGAGNIGSFGTSASAFFFQVAMIGLSIGFVLFYVIPFLPFIYFFFAVGGWVKGIFEAMVGVPLWALAHIRIDGDGLPSDAAMGGYYLILEIFLRPIFIIFGFIASIMLFTAQVQVLNEIWDVVVPNVGGGSIDNTAPIGVDQNSSINYIRNAVDEFFFTVMYAIMCYMLGMASFKLIDLIPNHILRWMGASVETFGEQSGDPAQNLVRNSFIGAQMVSDPLKQAGQAAVKAGGETAKGVQQIFGRTGQQQ